MDFHDRLRRYFGTADLDKAVEDEADRNFAREFMDMMVRVQGD